MKILIILGHPAKERKSFCEVLSLAYFDDAKEAKHEVHFLKIANLKFDPILHEGYNETQVLEPDLIQAQNEIKWADHLVFVFPMWNYLIPALLKGFIERTFTEGFAYIRSSDNQFPKGLLKGKSARIIQTMGMPSFVYKWFLMEHVTKALKSGLKVCGIKPISVSYFGRIENHDDKCRGNMIQKVRLLGSKAS